MAVSKTEWTLAAVNQRLKDGHVKVSVEQIGGMLALRATLPPKPGSDRPKPYRQRIFLKLPANPDGFRRAEGEARLLGSRLVSGQFDWNAYMPAEKTPQGKPVAQWVKEFKAHYMETHTLKPSTWENHWAKVFKRLPQDQPLTKDALMGLVQSTERNTRNRKETCNKLQHLARFAGLEVDLLQYQGNYGGSKVKDRDLPSDEAIARTWSAIPNPAWRWVFGIMAACGLRDHEVFFCHWTDEGLQVTQGKTGPRLVFQPLYPEWVDAWNLRSPVLPNIQNVQQLYEAGKLGDKVARGFRRYKVPFSPYSLRHAYGIRSSVTFKLPVTTAAALMGHSPKEHLETYHRHISLKANQDAARQVMERGDRPKAPQ
ncbi:MAG: site-specific integrase [Cyanobacteriota bacterium]